MTAIRRARHRWIEPLILAGSTVSGLACALLYNGPGEIAGDLMLAAPLLAILRHILHASRKQAQE